MIVRKTQYLNAALGQFRAAHTIVPFGLRIAVLAWVEFDGQGACDAIEIQNIAGHRVLPAKFETRQTTTPQNRPEPTFRVGRFVAHPPGKAAKT